MESPEQMRHIDGKGIEPCEIGGVDKKEEEKSPDKSADIDSKNVITFDLCRFCARPFPGCISLFSPEGGRSV
jgi:hypothetical protein